MPNPYRAITAPEPRETAGEARDDDYILGLMLIVLGSIRVTLALATGEDFDAEATIAGLMLALGVLVSVSAFARR